MDGALIGMILDGIVLLFLAVTIFFSVRLSSNMAAFRSSRKELDKLVQDLSRNIDRAEAAIAGMKSASREAGAELQERMNKARIQADELNIMTEAGDNLAARLERLADRGRDAAARMDTSGAASPGLGAVAASVKRKEPAFAGFNIRDREFEDDDAGVDLAADDLSGGDDDADMFHSKAERELFAAINKGRR